MSDTLFAVYEEPGSARRAVDELQNRGFLHNQIGILLDEGTRQTLFGDVEHTGAGRGALKGGLAGGIIGAVVASAIVLPGVGLVGGLLATILASAGLGAAAGGLVGALAHLGFGEEDARAVAERIESGHVLVSVDAPNAEHVAAARAAFELTGASEIHRVPHAVGTSRERHITSQLL